MVLLIHISIAIASILFSGLTVFFPTHARLKSNYLLIAGVLATGTWLTFLKPDHLPQTCLSGILYLSLVVFLLMTAKRKLAIASEISK